jgi:carboxyl-terminal processing protease
MLRLTVLSLALPLYATSQNLLGVTDSEFEGVSDLVSFVSPANFESTVEDLRNEFVGVGIQFYPYRSEYVTIARVLYGSPAAAAGVRAGDRITEIDGVSMRYMSPHEIVRRMSGEVGESLTMTIERAFRPLNTGPDLTVELERTVVYLPSIEEARVLPDGVGYLRIGTLGDQAAEEIRGRVRDLLEDGVHGIVIDARWLSGGYVRAAADVASLFLPAGTLIGYIQPGKGSTIAIRCDGEPILPTGLRAALLANGTTGGAAELLAAAFREGENTRLVGQVTAGAADVARTTSLLGFEGTNRQTEYLLAPDNSGIHGRGVSPEIDAVMTAEEDNVLRMQLFESFMGDPELENAQNHGVVSGNDASDVAIEDFPLVKAVEWVTGR